MNEKEIINAACADILKKMFSTLFERTQVAATAADHAQAEQDFAAGVRLARQVRDKAITLL